MNRQCFINGVALFVLGLLFGIALMQIPEISFRASLTGEICDNDIDDDSDVLIDCADDDCINDPACPYGGEICDNDIDDDNDTLIDCADDDCISECFEQDCTNDVDDDEDQMTDCDDDDCDSDPACAGGNSEIGNCDDNVDNDSDGDTDCNDSDCSADPACL